MNLGINTIDLYLTGKCNLKCSYCYGEDDSNPHMTKKTIDACLDFAQEAGIKTVELCGGEPLLSPHFEYAVKEIRKRKWDIILRTNGLFLHDYLDLVAKTCKWVGISLDGLEAVNALMRPSKKDVPTEQQFLKPLEAIYDLKKRNPDIQILLASVASKKNYKDLAAFKAYIDREDVPIDKWKIYQFITDKFRSILNEGEHAITRTEFNHVIDRVPSPLKNGAPIIHQRSDEEGSGGNCLLVYHSGKIKILEKEYGVIGVDSNDRIRSNLLNGDVLKHIGNNKGKTYDQKTTA